MTANDITNLLSLGLAVCALGGTWLWRFSVGLTKRIDALEAEAKTTAVTLGVSEANITHIKEKVDDGNETLKVVVELLEKHG